MRDREKSSVGIIILSEIGSDRCAALVRRGHYKVEIDKAGKKRLMEESFAGLSQPTAHGGQTIAEKCLGTAGIVITLEREIREETNLNPTEILKFAILLGEFEDTVKRCVIYAAYLPLEKVLELRFEPCTGLNILRQSETDLIRTDARREGFFKRGTAMFASDKKALKRAFERFDEMRALYHERSGA